MVDYKSDAGSIFYYASAQFAYAFSKFRLDRTSGVVTRLGEIQRDKDVGFVPVTAMNPNDQRNFALAAVDGSVMFYEFMTPTIFCRKTAYVSGSQSSITAMTYSSNGIL